MPIYEYHCTRCGTDFEKLVLPSTEVACPTCQAQDLTRRLSMFGFRGGLVASAGGGCGCGAGGCGCSH